MIIKKFKNFINESSVYNLEDINPYEIMSTREGVDSFFDILKNEINASIKRTTTYGYEVEITQEHIDLLNTWKEKYDFEFETDRVTNREHPRYGETFFKFNVFRDSSKRKDVSKYFKKLNQ